VTDFEPPKIGCSENHIVFGDVNEFISVGFHIYCQIWVKFSPHIVLLNMYEFRENQLVESCLFLVGLNEITCTPVPGTLRYFDSKGHIGKVCA
jgi:hypothetical protein